jgi:hypothetical protein
MLLAVSLPLFSQSAVGTILGSIYDSSGGVIAGAKVTITDVARGTTRALTTDEAGKYTAPTLLSGTYTVRAELSGFATAEQTNVLLEVAQNVRVDLTLSPGQQTEVITVNEEIPAIDTTSATLGGTVSNQSITALPLVTRNFLQLLQLRPGVVDVPGGTGTATVTNGRRQGADVLLIEGVTQFDLATSNVLINGAQQGGSVSILPVDSIQEFSSQQNPPAEYGWRDGSAVNVGIKSGTNAIHGTAYAFGRNALWTDARTFAATGEEKVNRLTVAQPGFAVGGPLIKNKLFWFASAEFIRQSVINTAAVTTPSDVPGLGPAFSMVDACNQLPLGRASVNPLSAQIAGLPPGSCIPLPASATFENLFPYNPNNSPNIFPNPATTSSSNNGLAKIDWNPNERHHLNGLVYISKDTSVAEGSLQPYWGLRGIGSTEEFAGSWTYTPNSSWVNELRGGAAPNTGTGIGADLGRLPADPYPTGYSVNTGVSNRAFGSFPNIQITGLLATGLGQPMQQRGKRGPQYQLDVSDKVSHLFGNHSLKFGYEEVFVHFNNNSIGNTNGTIGFTSLQNFLTGNVNTATIITGDISVAYRERWHAAFIQDTWRITPRVTLTPGIRWEYIGSPHSVDNRLANFDPTQPGGVVQTGPGLPNSTQIHPQKTNFNPRMGVAWDMFGNGKTVLRGGIGNLSSFPAILTITGGQNTTAPYGATLCTGPSTPNTPVSVSCAGSNMVINRYGTPANARTVQTFSPGATINWTTNCTNPLITSTCSGPPIFPLSAAVSPTTGPTCTASSPCSMLPVDPNFKNPKSLQWNLDIQRALTSNLTLDVAYVGTHGYDEVHTIDLNQPPNGTGWNTPWTAAQLAAQTGTAASRYSTGAANVGLTSAQICLGQGVAADAGKCKPNTFAIEAARPYANQFPYYRYIAETTNGFHSNYAGLQVALNARNYHGLSFLTAYTWSHALDHWTKSSQATTALADPNNLNYQYGSSDFDVRHRLRFSPTYFIPGIKSRGQMLEGWSLSAIWALQTGFPFAPRDSRTNDWAGNGENLDSTIPTPNNGVWQSWNYSGPASAFSGNGINPIPCYGVLSGCKEFASAPSDIQIACNNAAQAPYVGNTTLQQLALRSLANNACYIQNGGVLTPPAYGTLGNASRGIFTGPNYQNVDATVAKVWHMKERYSVQLRVECYNVFNHVNFAQFTDGTSDPSAGGGVLGVTGFGYHTAGQGTLGTNRQFQFGLKLTF